MPDVITVTTGTTGVAGNVSSDLITYMSSKMLDVAELFTVLDQFGEAVPLPASHSKTIRFVREEKLPVSASPTQLVEGIPPDAIGITVSQVEATVEQYGVVVRLSDLAELTAMHPIVQRTLYNLGLQSAEIYDQLIYNVLDAATNVFRPNAKAADTSLVHTDTISYVDLVKLDATLHSLGARTFGSGEYVLVTSSQPYASITQDATFLASHQLVQPESIWKGEVSMLGNFRIVRSNAPGFAATSQVGAGQSDKVYSSFALGMNAYQISDLQSLRTYVVPPGGQTDPLEQNRLMGFKFAFKAVISNQTWIRRVRSAGADSVTNP